MSKRNPLLKDLSNALTETGLAPESGRRITKAQTRKLMKVFESVPDGRIKSMCDYPLPEVLLLVFLGVLSNCNLWTDLELYGRANIRWLRKFYPYKEGTPSHDELRYIFSRIPTDCFQKAIIGYLTANIDHIRRCLGLETSLKGLIHYAIDGKEENGTGRSFCASRGEKVRNQQTLHVWNVTDDLCIYSEAIDKKTNEIPVAQKFLKSQKSLKGILITFDALHTQKATWKIILKKQGEAIGGLKGNQSGLLEDVSLCFDEDTMKKIREKGIDYHMTLDKAHSQVETREYYRIDACEDEKRDREWGKITSFICVVKTIEPTAPSKSVSREIRYYISTLDDVVTCAEGIRGHWACERGHWCLDVVFDEDGNTTMDIDAYQNLSLMIKMVLHLIRLLKAHPAYSRYSMKNIRRAVSWDPDNVIRDLFSMLNGNTLQEMMGDVKMTAADKKKAKELLEEEKDLYLEDF